MEIDARMYAVTEQKLSETDLKLASGQLTSIVGRGAFFIDKKGEYDGKIQHALSFGKFDEAKFEHTGNCGTLIRVNLMGRYYGPGYERGPWPEFKLIAEWLELNLDPAIVYYGKDSSDELEKFDEAKRKEYHHHFLTVGHEPYRGYTGNTGGLKLNVLCDFCGGRPMHDVGGGGNRTFWSCDGCDARIITSPNGTVKLAYGQNFF